jgi:hypothetical protein
MYVCMYVCVCVCIDETDQFLHKHFVFEDAYIYDVMCVWAAAAGIQYKFRVEKRNLGECILTDQ